MAGARGGLQHWGDYLTIALYFVVVLSVGVWSICRARRSSVKDYFLAGRSVSWWPIGLSLFASNIGSEHFVGLAGTGSASGFAVIAFEWNAIILLLMLAWVFLPMYFASGIYTMPEYLFRRYGGQRLRIYLSVLALATYIFNNISVDLYSGAVFIQQAMNWDIYVSVFILLGIVGVYVILGGLNTVIFTDAAQVFIMLIGSVILAIMSFVRVGGWEALYTKYMEAVPQSVFNQTSNSTARCGYPREDAFHIFRDPNGDDYPWIGLMLRTSLVGMWYWCANQVIVQRSLAAKSITHAKGASILAGYLKIIPLFIMVMPGMIARVLFPDEVGCATPETCEAVCGNKAGCSNIAYPLLVLEVLPLGLRGLLLAVMMSAVVSTLTSTFNSASTVFTLDLWRRFRKRASDVETLVVSRIFVLILCVLGVLWMPLMQNAQGGQLFQYATAITGYLQAPTCAVFIMSAFWSRATEPGAFYGMLAGQVVGLVRFILDFAYEEPRCGEPDLRPAFVSQIHYLYFAEIQIAVALSIAVPVSYMTKPMPKEKLAGLTFWTVKDKLQEKIARANVTSTDLEYDASGAKLTSESMVKFDVDNSGSDEKVNDSQIENGDNPGETAESSWRQWLRSICGLPPKGAAESHHHSLKLAPMSLEEKPFWRGVTNLNAVVILVVLGFLYGFFA